MAEYVFFGNFLPKICLPDVNPQPGIPSEKLHMVDRITEGKRILQQEVLFAIGYRSVFWVGGPECCPWKTCLHWIIFQNMCIFSGITVYLK